MTTPNNSLSSHLPKNDNDEQQQQFRSTSSTITTTTNGHDENSELDSISFNDEHREEIDDLQQSDDGQMENYDQLRADIIETLTEQSKNINTFIFSDFAIIYLDKNNNLTKIDIENQAYEMLLEHMQSKFKMQV
jgi:hypothetical protein